MPIITTEGPPIKDIEKKREFVYALSETASKIYGIPIEHIVVLIKENKQENVGSGGKLIIDKIKNM